MCAQRGRPVLDNERKKLYRVEIRMNGEENELLEKLSRNLGISKSETIIKALNLLSEQK